MKPVHAHRSHTGEPNPFVASVDWVDGTGAPGEQTAKPVSSLGHPRSGVAPEIGTLTLESGNLGDPTVSSLLTLENS